MILAVLGAVNGRADLLGRAISEVEQEGIQCLLQTGNIVGEPGHSAESIALLQQHSVQCVCGVSDLELLRFGRKPDSFLRKEPEECARLARIQAGLRAAQTEWIRGLPKRRVLELDGLRILLCYGSPGNPAELLEMETPLTRFKRQREAFPAHIIICGGASESFSRWVDGTLFVHPGPLALSPRSIQYSCVNTETEPWSVELRTLDALLEDSH